MNSKQKVVFVTVGTTYFDELIEKFDQENILQALVDAGYTKITYQIGKGNYEPKNCKNFKGIDNEIYRYKPSLLDDMKGATLIVSACGAGTLLECLRLEKKVIGVINERLMNNHQVEILDVLEKDSYMLGFRTMSDVDKGIKQVLDKIEKGAVKAYPAPIKNKINDVIEDLF